MDIEKFLWSKTRAWIIKYLLFKRQWVSIRALESELNWSFTAIKKQVDSLLEADIISIDKDNNKWSIYLNTNVADLIKRIFLYSLEFELKTSFNTYSHMIDQYYLWKVFWNKLDFDIVLIYKNCESVFLDQIKKDISEIFYKYYIDNVWVVFMQVDDFNRRYRLADKFVLSLITNCKNQIWS